MLILLAILGVTVFAQVGAYVEPDELLAIEQLSDKNYINRYYNTWEYPYYFLPQNRPGRQLNEPESKSLPIFEVPVSLSNPIVNLIARANKFYRMIRNKPVSKKALQQRISHQFMP